MYDLLADEFLVTLVQRSFEISFLSNIFLVEDLYTLLAWNLT